MPKETKKNPRANYMMMENALTKMDIDLNKNNINSCKENISARNGESVTDWIQKCNQLPDDNFECFKTPATEKKRKLNKPTNAKSWQKNFEDAIKKQVEKRKMSNENLLRSLSALIARLESEGSVIQENDQRIQQLYAAQMKMSQAALTAHRQKVQALQEIKTEYLKDFEENEKSDQQENKKLEKELTAHMMELQEKLQDECRRKNVETFRKAISMMMDS